MRVRMEDLIRTVREAAPLFRDKERAAKIQVKGAADFVTQVDFQVQEYVKARLEALEPEIQFMGEEKDNGAIDFSRPAWILDPVDGTTNLIHDFRASVISLALWQDGDVRMGVVYQPYTDEMFTAVRGGGAFLNGEPIRVSSAAHLREALISIGTSPYHKSWRMRISGGSRRYLSAAGTSAGLALPPWSWPTQPADGWTAFLSGG